MDEIPKYYEFAIIKAWLKGKTRDEIAEEFGKSQGTISNIISRMRNGLGRYDAEAMRELARKLRELDMTPDNCMMGCRVSKILEKLKIPENEIAEFLKAIFQFSQQLEINTEILREAILEFVKISEKLPFSQIPSHLQQKGEEAKELENKKNRLEEEIQILEKEKLAIEETTRSSLKVAKITSVDLDIFVKTKNELENYGIPLEDIDRFKRCVQGIKNYSYYDPFKVIEKISNLETLENEIEDNQKIKETESAYDDRLNVKYIKLKNIEELEKTVGFSIQDLKKLKNILIEISSEHKGMDNDQIKLLFFKLVEEIETRITLESKNNRLLQMTNILQNQIQSKQHILNYQELVGPCLKNLFEYGIQESDIVGIKALLDILLYNIGKDTVKLNEKQEIINNLSNYSNLKLAKANIIREINAILNTTNLEKIQNHINNLNKSFNTTNNSDNLSDRKHLVLCDSIS